jgi:hypothetical protein
MGCGPRRGLPANWLRLSVGEYASPSLQLEIIFVFISKQWLAPKVELMGVGESGWKELIFAGRELSGLTY